METANKLQEQGYTGVKVTSMLQACLSVEIRNHLRLVQLDNLSSIKNKHFKKGYISKPEMTLLWNIYWNFVLNDYRFEDKSKKCTKVSKITDAEANHIGLQMLNNLNNQKTN